MTSEKARAKERERKRKRQRRLYHTNKKYRQWRLRWNRAYNTKHPGYPIRHAAEMVGISHYTIFRWEVDGKIPTPWPWKSRRYTPWQVHLMKLLAKFHQRWKGKMHLPQARTQYKRLQHHIWNTWKREE